MTMYLCTKCLSRNVTKVDRKLHCNDCSITYSIIKYNRDLKKAHNIVSIGFQYRKRSEYESRHNSNIKRAFYLKELHNIFSFVGLAVISGLIGNFSYDKLKQILKTILNDPLIIEINDKEFQRFLKSETQQKKFIKYIEEYRNKQLLISSENDRQKKVTNKKLRPKKNYR